MPRKKSKVKKVIINLLKWFSAIAPIVIFIYILYYYGKLDFLTKKEEKTAKTIVLADEGGRLEGKGVKPEVLSQIRLVNNEWHTVGGLAIHNITIENKSNESLSGVELEFKYLSDTQTVLTSKVISVKSAIAPHTEAKLPEVSVGYVNRAVVGCDVNIVKASI